MLCSCCWSPSISFLIIIAFTTRIRLYAHDDDFEGYSNSQRAVPFVDCLTCLMQVVLRTNKVHLCTCLNVNACTKRWNCLELNNISLKVYHLLSVNTRDVRLCTQVRFPFNKLRYTCGYKAYVFLHIFKCSVVSIYYLQR